MRLSYVVLLVALVAWWLRLDQLGGQSLWYDEGISLAMVGRTPGEILFAAAADIHPPLYYVILWGWAHLAGASEFSARFVSALASAAIVAVTWVIARRLTESR